MSNLPVSYDAEESLCGSVLINPGIIKLIDVEPADFFLSKLQKIWLVFQELASKNKAIDIMTVSERLKAKGELENVGGAAYLTQLINQPANSANADAYAEIVREYAQRRGMINIASEMVKTAYDINNDLDIEQSRFPRLLIDNVRVKNGSGPVSKWMMDGFSMIEDAHADPNKKRGVTTGFKDCDNIFGWFSPGITIIGGAPGVGKTIFVTDIVLNNVLDKCPVPGAFYSSEMSAEDMTFRIYSRQTGLSAYNLRRGIVQDNEWEKLVGAMGQIGDAPLWVSDSASWTLAGLRADLTRLKYEHGIEFFAFDYLEWIRDGLGEMEKHERSEYIGLSLQRMCRELDIVGFIVQKLNKSGFSGVAKMDDFSGGSGLMYDAPNMIVLNEHIPDKGFPQKKNMRTGVIRKGRNLEKDSRHFHLVLLDTRPQFGDAAPWMGQEAPASKNDKYQDWTK